MKQTTELIIKTFCIILLVILCIAIYINGKDLSCNKCSLTIKKQEGRTLNKYQVNISSLYNEYKLDKCYQLKLEDLK